jgi:Phosphotransferase enzyme family
MYADVALRLPSTSARWHSSEFRAELSAWVAESVGGPLSMEPVRDRPWSTVWRVLTDAGVHFAKQNAPLQGFEAALMVELASVAPTHVVPLTAADAERGLLLTPDLGSVFGERIDLTDMSVLVEVTGRVVGAAAELQRAVVGHADRLVAAGLVRLAPVDVVGYVEQRLVDFASLPANDPRALTSDQTQRIEACLPELSRVVDTVSSLGLPLTLQHNDLHMANVFEVKDQLRFFDFGDAFMSEPLAALMVPLRGLASLLKCGPDDPRVLRAAEPALEVWSDVAPLPALRAALPSALRLARLARAESWLRCLPSMTESELAEFGDAASYWLAEIAER